VTAANIASTAALSPALCTGAAGLEERWDAKREKQSEKGDKAFHVMSSGNSSGTAATDGAW